MKDNTSLNAVYKYRLQMRTRKQDIKEIVKLT